MENRKHSRRSFLGKAMALGAAVAFTPELLLNPRRLFASNGNDALNSYTVNLSDYPKLDTVGGSVSIVVQGIYYRYSKTANLLFRFLLTRVSPTTFIAEQGYCTHSFSVLKPYNGSTIDCTLTAASGHGSQYDINGVKLVGPESSNLPIYATSYDSVNGTVTIDVPNVTFGVDNSKDFPTELYQNFPNPVKTITTIKFKLGYYSHVTLTVTDMLGHTIAVLTDGLLPSGEHSYDFDASIWNVGTYFYTLNIEGQSFTKQMVVIK